MLGGTSDQEIAAFMAELKPIKGMPSFGGVFSNDELNNPDRNKIYILNLQNSDEGGSHWTLLHNGWYFDSYGVVPTKRISRFVKSWNKNDYQGLNRNSCGHFCMYVAVRLMAGLPPTSELISGKQTHNENVLEAFFYL